MKTSFTLLAVLCTALTFSDAQAQVDEAGFRQALKLKKGVYLLDGAFTGGDRLHSMGTISGVRIAANPAGYDRLVIDFDQLSRPPFFMVEKNDATQRVTVSVQGKMKLDFSSQSAIQAARKARRIASLNFIPPVDSDRWTFSMKVQPNVKAEVFELTSPARIIIDLKP